MYILCQLIHILQEVISFPELSCRAIRHVGGRGWKKLVLCETSDVF